MVKTKISMASSKLKDIERKRHYWRRNAGVWALAFLLCILAMIVLYEVGVRRAYERLADIAQQQVEAELELQVQILEGRLEKYRLLPPLLGRHSELTMGPQISQDYDQVWLQEVTYLTGAEEVAILNADGSPIISAQGLLSAEQWMALTQLYQPPLEGRLGRQFIEPNKDQQWYGFASRLQNEKNHILAVVVDLALVYQSWALSQASVIAYDESQIIRLASDLNWLGVSLSEHPNEDGTKDYAKAVIKLNTLGWFVEVTEPIDDQALIRQYLLVSTIIVLATVVAFALLIRRREQHIKQELRDRVYAHELESKIEERTIEIKTANANLTEEVEERRRTEQQLKTTQKELIHSAKLAAIGQMSTTLSHEYNQPLATMRTYAENAIKLLERNKPETVKENLERIVTQTDRLGHLSKVLMSFARKPTDSKNQVSLYACVEEAIMLLQPRIKNNSVVIRHRITQHDSIYGNATQLSQVLLNIIANAIDAIQQDAHNNDTNIRKNTKSNNIENVISISATKDDQACTITIEDSGPGIPEHLKSTLFDPFVTSKSASKGLGLGLSVVKDIILDHQGHIQVSDSTLGGACFTIRLPQESAIN